MNSLNTEQKRKREEKHLRVLIKLNKRKENGVSLVFSVFPVEKAVKNDVNIINEVRGTRN